MPAGLDERCGWCAYHVPTGAHICGACGARRVEKEVERPTSMRILDGIAGAFGGAIIGFIIMLFTDKPIAIVWCAGLCASLNVNLNKTMTDVSWYR